MPPMTAHNPPDLFAPSCQTAAEGSQLTTAPELSSEIALLRTHIALLTAEAQTQSAAERRATIGLLTRMVEALARLVATQARLAVADTALLDLNEGIRAELSIRP